MMRTTHEIDVTELPRRAERLLDDGHRLALVAAHHDDRGPRVLYLFV
ncbi:hypothetical protein [Streptomyces sp. 3213.3]|nr:hypothetical protein [Streptomyces sp. 3213.3]